MQVYIITTVGNSTPYVFDVEQTTTIRQLKDYYLKKANRKEDPEKLILTLNATQLDEDDKTLFDYRIGPDSMLTLTYSDFKGRNPTFGVHFVDVSNETGLKRAEWAKTAPKWRIASSGLCLEGLCKNKACEANNQKVVMSMGYIEFDVLKDPNVKTTKCPICFKFVNPITCAFNNCWWKYEGIKQPNESEEPEPIESTWKYADNAYHYFDEYTSGTVQWRHLRLTAVETKPKK
ncbi:unnamed protein product [Rotaria sp. Silwood1]|nr:unnamed protein product [Rotaria sp. Silwood1]CAF1583548.1 unnamed protein product [Rotaria sp. Silwood1]CAF3753708.1 unnamed protein product [Rotaria sp. Silwood1]CAF3754678.1 unnamed protein product [Rotaria sp. Silwood1]CAF3804300.1 unnamed protein product [Rotaria sp. Silwood1]